MYALDVSSLQSLDQNEELNLEASLRDDLSPVSCNTGATRYFSATSRLAHRFSQQEARFSHPLASSSQAADNIEFLAQRDRAVANGALRFVSRKFSAATSAATGRSAKQEDIVPVTVTSHGRTGLHLTAKIRGKASFGGRFDGAEEVSPSQLNESRSRGRWHRLFQKAKSRRMLPSNTGRVS